jgi:integrase
MTRKYHKLTDGLIDAWTDFDFGDKPDAKARVVWDANVRGLQIRVGKKRVTWSFLKEHRRGDKRSTTFRRLGFWPGMSVNEARKSALREAGRIAAGRISPGKRDAIKFEAAIADYITYLEEKATRAGKPPTWSKLVRTVANRHLLPAFGSWSLIEMSGAPATIREFHERLTKETGPIGANQACRIITACYKFSAREDRALPVQLPTSSVRPNPEPPSTAGLRFEDFLAWREAWERIESPIRRGFHLVNLLTGCRPGELARLRRSGIQPKQRLFVIPRGKSGNDIRVVLDRS